MAAFTKPSYDHDEWVPKYFAPAWSRTQQLLPPSLSCEAIALKLDPSINDDTLRSVLTILRRGHDMYIFNLANPMPKEVHAGEYMRSIVANGMCRLLNHYLDNVAVIEKLVGQNTLTGRQITHARVQTIVSLALFYWGRFVSITDSVVIGTGKAVFCSNPGILTRLRKAYGDYDTLTLKAEKIPYSRQALFAVYVGAWAEQMKALGTGQTEVEKQWFNSKFGAHASKMGLRTWEEVREVLIGFLHNDFVPPNGSIWFQKTLKEFEKSKPEVTTEDENQHPLGS